MIPLLWLGEPGCDQSMRTGGKAAKLARLAARYPVPPGFCLTAEAHAACLGETLPPVLVQAVEQAYADLGQRCGTREPAVAVRSSAVDEDGTDASFAGIYVTYLNVCGASAVVQAITRCWASAADPRVAAYRTRRGLAPNAGIAVLVQHLIAADVAAVVFSINPTTGAREELVINANYGLGESIVGGLATPDSWIVRRADHATIRFDLGHKERMTVLSGDGTREIPVLRTLRARPCLRDEQVRELVALALRLEHEEGWPVDIECAYHGQDLCLLQCRPVTTGQA